MDDKVTIDYAKYARIFKVMSNPKRLKIIDMLSEGELCACKILEEFHITQPTLSHCESEKRRKVDAVFTGYRSFK